MTDAWEWVGPIRARHFDPPLAGGYRLELVDADSYWEIHEAELRQHFPPDAYFDRSLLISQARRASQERLAACQGGQRLEDHWLVRTPDGALAGVVAAVQRNPETFELFHVNLHPDHRGRGLYRELLDRVVAYADELGFSSTVSEHAPCNNAVLIRHLKAGFQIIAFEIGPLYGLSVRLAYFHDPQLRRAYEYRCGLAVMDDHLHATGSGHFALLDDQFAAGRARNRSR